MSRALAGTLVVVALVVGAIVAFAPRGGALGKDKDVSGTRHNVSAPGVSPCTMCHIPQDEDGKALWAGNANQSGLFAGMRPLCFSCHDGTVTAVGAYVFNPSTPTHLSSPGIRGQDCDRCHDPHDTGAGKFLKYTGGANICQNCHASAGPTNHPINVDAIAAGVVPVDRDFDPYSGDFSGTRLWNAGGTGPGPYVKCMSCHSPHGGAPGTKLSTIRFTGTGHSDFLPLCMNCHSKQGSFSLTTTTTTSQGGAAR